MTTQQPEPIDIPAIAAEFALDFGGSITAYTSRRHHSTRLDSIWFTEAEKRENRLLRLHAAANLLSHHDERLAVLIDAYIEADKANQRTLIDCTENDAMAACNRVDDFVDEALKLAAEMRDDIPEWATKMMEDEE